MFGIASPLILLLFISMVPVEAVAQAVEARDGNIFFISRDGSRKQLTMLGLDSQPNLWSDGNRVVFVRRTPDLKIETGVPGPRGECCQIDNELWIADVTGAKQPKRILRGHAGIYKIGPDLVLGGFQSPQFSVEGRIVFFEANTWATDGAIYSLDLTSGFLRLICVGIGFQVITEGKYKGYLIANKNMPNYPTHVHSYWLLDPVGKLLRQIGDGGQYALSRFKDQNGVR